MRYDRCVCCKPNCSVTPCSVYLCIAAWHKNECMIFCADGPRCHGGETVTGRVHAAENGNSHGLEKTWREGEERSQQRCDVSPRVIQRLMLLSPHTTYFSHVAVTRLADQLL